MCTKYVLSEILCGYTYNVWHFIFYSVFVLHSYVRVRKSGGKIEKTLSAVNGIKRQRKISKKNLFTI